jgi:NADP-reducing hydrogenase subunit HndB
MDKIKSLAELKKRKEDLQAKEISNKDAAVQIKVAMATCGIASGAKEVMEVLKKECEKRSLKAAVTQTGCMGYCYAEPTVEVKKPGEEPIVFGYVNCEKAEQIVAKYLVGGEVLEGVIPVNYEII